MSDRVFFNAQHAPIGAFASFTLGCEGANGGFGLELGGPAHQNVFVGLERGCSGEFDVLPFYQASASAEATFDVEGNAGRADAGVRLFAFPKSTVQRDFRLASDVWTAGDLSFAIYTPVVSIPDPDQASHELVQETTVPAVFVELTIDNREGETPRRGFFGFEGTDPCSAMRRLDETTGGSLVGVAQGRHLAIAAADPAFSSIGLTMEQAVATARARTRATSLGSSGAVVVVAPPKRRTTFRFAVCFFRQGTATTGIDAAYLYTRYFANLEEVAAFAASHFDRHKDRAELSNRLLERAPLSDDQRFLMTQAIRSYYGSTELLDHDGRALWVVNEGEYRMMNTFDLTVDHLFFELRMNPWTVRNVLDLYASRYRFTDTVKFTDHEGACPGGISFTHDMGVANSFSPPSTSAYEQAGRSGCFSHMTHEQLVNWVLCAAVYYDKTRDEPWLVEKLPILEACLASMQNRDHPDPDQRDGIMKLDSSRTEGGAEITTYDSLDASLGRARGNVYLAVKCWAAYVLLERIFAKRERADVAAAAGRQATLCAHALVSRVREDGTLPALTDGSSSSHIIPAIEGLVFPWFAGARDSLDPMGRFGRLVSALGRHLSAVLVPGDCLFDDGGWKMSSTSDNSWLSKIFLCQFVARRILSLPCDERAKAADAAHASWLLSPESRYYAFSDQMVLGVAKGSRYYPRGVTAVLWLDEADAP